MTTSLTNTSNKVIGLMSGTSLDGVDAVVVDFAGDQPKTLATFWIPYPAELRQQAFNLQAPRANELHLAALLSNALSRCYADAVTGVLESAKLKPTDISAIGCHGQTVRHQPAAGYTVQLVNPALLAELTGIRVVADFRSRDIAAGGQGAPLVPSYHEAVFRDDSEHRVILNLGGIANLTDLPAWNSGKSVRGFDSGPGNVLMDGWIERHSGKHFDEDGAWAKQGKVLADLLEVMQHDPFFTLPPPKSCGRDGFNLRWLDARLIGGEAPEDVQATLAELTAVTVAQAVEQFCAGAAAMFLCGGGASNGHLVARLKHHLPKLRVENTSALGQPSDWVEAVAFAWLAWRTLNGETSNLPEVTGARGARVLGAIYPA